MTLWSERDPANLLLHRYAEARSDKNTISAGEPLRRIEKRQAGIASVVSTYGFTLVGKEHPRVVRSSAKWIHKAVHSTVVRDGSVARR